MYAGIYYDARKSTMYHSMYVDGVRNIDSCQWVPSLYVLAKGNNSVDAHSLLGEPLTQKVFSSFFKYKESSRFASSMGKRSWMGDISPEIAYLTEYYCGKDLSNSPNLLN